jgi:protein-S-isoprenylcysteine O-methyltransferase Ste14
MSFQATEGEFRNRFWIIAGIIWGGFLLYAVDHVNAAEALTRLILRTSDENSAAFGHCITAVFAFATFIVTMGAFIRSWAESYLHSSIVHDAALHGEQLVADGPYRYVRNPLYLGNLCLAGKPLRIFRHFDRYAAFCLSLDSAGRNHPFRIPRRQLSALFRSGSSALA